MYEILHRVTIMAKITGMFTNIIKSNYVKYILNVNEFQNYIFSSREGFSLIELFLKGSLYLKIHFSLLLQKLWANMNFKTDKGIVDSYKKI